MGWAIMAGVKVVQVGRVRVGQAMERDDQMTALWQGSGRKTLRIFFGG